MRVRLVLLLAAVAALFAFVAGCGGGGDDGGSDPAALMPAGAPVYVEASIRPDGELASNINSLAKNLAGIDDVGAQIIEELESSAVASGEDFDFDKEVSPWLGEKAGLYLQEYDGEDFEGYGAAIETTDTGAAQDFIDKVSADDEPEEGDYEGVDFLVETDDGSTVGIIGDFLVVAETEDAFKAMVDAEGGDSLAEQDNFGEAIGSVPEGSFADVFVDIGALIEETGSVIDSETQLFLETAGIDPKDATAVASLVPGADQIEIDFSTNAAGETPPTGDASALLEAMPADAFFAFAAPELGARLGESIEMIDEQGIEGQLNPNELKSSLKAEGIDIDKITGSIGDVALFAEGDSKENLTGAAVIEATDSKEATNTVSNLGLLLRASGTPGVSAYTEGGATGFSVRSAELGSQPLVVAAKDDRIAISYGLEATTKALAAGAGDTLAQDPEFETAKDALGGTPISGFVNGPATVELIGNLLENTDLEEFESLRPYLDKASYMAIGSGVDGDLATAKLILGLNE